MNRSRLPPSEYRGHGNDPAADLLINGPKRIGRFDLKREEMLDPLAVAEEAPSGTWDVLAHPNGRIYFTSFSEPAGWVDPASGEIGSLTALGDGLNELALGPDGSSWRRAMHPPGRATGRSFSSIQTDG